MSRRALLAAGSLLLFLAAALVWQPGPRSVAPAASGAKDPACATPGARPVRAGTVSPGGLPAPLLSPYPAGSGEHRSWVAERCAGLEELSWVEDASSMAEILAELTNPEAEIREAALDAVANFSGSDAIPQLEALAAACEDPAWKLALLQAAEELKIPTASEYFARKRAAEAVRR